MSALLGAAALLFTGHALAAPAAPSLGHDISWPQCGGMSPRLAAVPSGHQPFIIVGLTNGHALHRNPCLTAQLGYAATHATTTAAYMMANRPTKKQLAALGTTTACGPADHACLLTAAGVAEATDALATLAAQGLSTKLLWIDVEDRPTQPWNYRDRAGNAAVLQGIATGLLQNGVEPGWYSTREMWHGITGAMTVNGGAVWYPIGRGSRATLRLACGRTFGGGHTVIGQAVIGRFDADTACGSGALTHHAIGAMSLVPAVPTVPVAVPTLVPLPTDSPSPAATPSPADTASPTPLPREPGSPRPTASTTASATPSASASPTASPLPLVGPLP